MKPLRIQERQLLLLQVLQEQHQVALLQTHEIGDIVADLFPPAVSGAKFVTAFKDHMFYAGMSSAPQEIVFSSPFIEDDFSSSWWW